MRPLCACTLLLVLLPLATTAWAHTAQAHAPPPEATEPSSRDWSYKCAAGSELLCPAEWGRVYAGCVSSVTSVQSPIDIAAAAGGGAPPSVEFAVDEGSSAREGGELVYNGVNVQVNFVPGAEPRVTQETERHTGNTETLVCPQVHFHTPSEHTFDGQTRVMVAHLVCVHDDEAHDGESRRGDAHGRVTVVAVTFEQVESGKGNKWVSDIATVVAHESAQTSGEWSTPITVRPFHELLPDSLDHWAYLGSFTTPPCRDTRDVQWRVLQHMVPVGEDDLFAFTALFHRYDDASTTPPQRGNTRPVQPLEGRAVELLAAGRHGTHGTLTRFGIAMGVVCGVLAIGGVVFLLNRRRNKRHTTSTTTTSVDGSSLLE